MSLLDLPLEINQFALAQWLELATLPLLLVAAGPEIAELAAGE